MNLSKSECINFLIQYSKQNLFHLGPDLLKTTFIAKNNNNVARKRLSKVFLKYLAGINNQ